MQYTSREVYEYISKQTNDPIVEWKTCAVAGAEFPIYESDYNFYNKISPTFAGTIFQIPTPSLCPEERQRRRLLFRNERKLYRRTCDFSGKEMISIYSPDKPYKVYDTKVRRSDDRDPMNYGIEFDFNKTFVAQYKDFMLQVPRWGIINVSDTENSPYTNFTAKSKNIYMCSDVYESEDVYYSCTIKNLKNCVDCQSLESSQECYNCLFSRDLFHCKNVIYSDGCADSAYLNNCFGVSHSLFCVGLANKSYYILNQQVSKEEFEKVMVLQDLSSYSEKYNKLLGDFPKLGTENLGSEDCFGNNLVGSKGSVFCFDAIRIQNSKYIATGYEMDYCMDTSIHNIDCLYSYEAVSGGKLVGSAFNVLGWGGRNMYYCSECIDSQNCFACIGLRNKSYCVFNKQYTKEQYEQLVGKIIRHMSDSPLSGNGIGEIERGEFFNPSLSTFGYNETVAQEYYPLTKEQAIQRGYKRQSHNYDPKIPENVKVIHPKEYNQEQRMSLRDDDDIAKQIIICTESGRPFRILKQELDFYRKHDLSLPILHPDIRHEHRMKLRPGRTLYLRNCDKCDSQMLSVYAQDYDGKVYCETCYKQEVYS